MIEDNLASEHIKLADRLGDAGTRHMLEDILLDEEEQAHQWEAILAK
jgi:DNA-binding ferritin-like protein